MRKLIRRLTRKLITFLIRNLITKLITFLLRKEKKKRKKRKGRRSGPRSQGWRKKKKGVEKTSPERSEIEKRQHIHDCPKYNYSPYSQPKEDGDAHEDACYDRYDVHVMLLTMLKKGIPKIRSLHFNLTMSWQRVKARCRNEMFVRVRAGPQS